MRRILYGLHGRESSFIVLEHGCMPNPQALEEARHQGRIETSTVYEQAVDIKDDADPDAGTSYARNLCMTGGSEAAYS
jgi:hypothetical protein